MKALRKAVRWGFLALAPCELVIFMCTVGGVRVAPAARLTAELAACALTAGATVLLLLDYRRHRGDGLHRRSAFLGAIAESVPASVRRLIRHEITLATSLLRRVTRRGPHGIRGGDHAVPYAPAQAAVGVRLMYGSGAVRGSVEGAARMGGADARAGAPQR
ncbi:hypothetical protein ACH5A3_44450 [Streptomyces echinatus]|uniref:hypothetical protein n=1 Tax=Streptomyces echinatus TaxID=67293 RepID=UPI003789468A